MNNAKKKKLEAKGWKVGSTTEFLGLSREESEFIQLKLALADCLKTKRVGKKFSQIDLAKYIKSSQSRIAKMEKGDPSVSVDLLIHSLLALGTTRKELAHVIGAAAH